MWHSFNSTFLKSLFCSSPVGCHIVVWWGRCLVEPRVCVSRHSHLGWSESLKKTLAAFFLVELILAACVLKFGWEKKAESFDIQHVNFYLTPFPTFSLCFGTPAFSCASCPPVQRLLFWHLHKIQLQLLPESGKEIVLLRELEMRSEATCLLSRFSTDLLPHLQPYCQGHLVLPSPGPLGTSVYNLNCLLALFHYHIRI